MYHHCTFQNRNRTRKLIDYKRGQTCVLATDEYCWKQVKQKYLVKKNHYTQKRRKELSNFFYLCKCCEHILIDRLSRGHIVKLQDPVSNKRAKILRKKFNLFVYEQSVGDLPCKKMPKYFVQYHRVSVSEGIDTETDMLFIGAEVNSDISQRCKKCQVLLYINKAFKKDKKICNICYDLLNDEHESGSIQIVWTENLKF